MSRSKTTLFELRSGAIDAVHLVVKTPDFAALTEALQQRFDATPEFFAGEAVAIDLRRLADNAALPLDDSRFLEVHDLARPLGLPFSPRLLPTVLLRYHRSRFVEPLSGSRISVDIDIEALRGHPRVLGNAVSERFGFAVVEIKGAGTQLPRALHVLQRLGARKAACSKYGTAAIAMLKYRQ